MAILILLPHPNLELPGSLFLTVILYAFPTSVRCAASLAFPVLYVIYRWYSWRPQIIRFSSTLLLLFLCTCSQFSNILNTYMDNSATNTGAWCNSNWFHVVTAILRNCARKNWHLCQYEQLVVVVVMVVKVMVSAISYKHVFIFDRPIMNMIW